MPFDSRLDSTLFQEKLLLTEYLDPFGLYCQARKWSDFTMASVEPNMSIPVQLGVTFGRCILSEERYHLRGTKEFPTFKAKVYTIVRFD
mmetsp:Transcript_364/g.1266  ORF Transcript_364/g.1266 Transcript_364/m.1266 type:complete len:89 (+) Transcript_364:245-511(+)